MYVNHRLSTAAMLLSLFAFLPNHSKAIPDWVPGKATYEKYKIDRWNETNKKFLTFSLQGSNLQSYKKAKSSVSATALIIEGSIDNKTQETIRCVIIDYFILNKTSNTVVAQKRIGIAVEVFPTITLALPRHFIASYQYDYPSHSALEELRRAAEQLGEQWTWSYNLVAYINQDTWDNVFFREIYKIAATVHPDTTW